MATAAEVAAWMHAAFERDGYLSQAEAVAGIRDRFGAGFLVGRRIRRDVLDAFRATDPQGRVFVGSQHAWRRRTAHAPAARGTVRGE